jgi:hypothetical protein
MAFKTIQPSEVPAFGNVEERAKSISPDISISETGYDFDRGLYCFRVAGPGGRNADVHFSREFLDDLRDNPASPTGKYTLELTAKLDAKLLEAIEISGLISFGEESLKFLLLKFLSDAVGLATWETQSIEGASRYRLQITVTPARHGPHGFEPMSGEVCGFAIEIEEPGDAIYVTGDTVCYGPSRK